MKTYVALLRGINVGGKRKIKMESLRIMLEDLGYHNVQTYIQSGNIIFQSNKETRVLSAAIEQAILDTYELEVPTIVIPKNEFEAILENCPFNKEDEGIILSKIYFSLLSKEVTQEQIVLLEQLASGEEDYEIGHKVIYIYCPNNYHKSKIHTNSLERKLKQAITTRNLKTMQKLLSLIQ